MAVPLQRELAMGKHERKDVKRLQLRREVIRLLDGDSLAQVHGGIGATCIPTCGWTKQNPTTISTGG
jgi:hypothetical protein